jgi:hypothetical protein
MLPPTTRALLKAMDQITSQKKKETGLINDSDA